MALAWVGRIVALVGLGSVVFGCPAGDTSGDRGDRPGSHVGAASMTSMSGPSGQGGGQAGSMANMPGGSGGSGGSVASGGGSGGMQSSGMGPGAGGSGGTQPLPGTGGSDGMMPAAIFDAGSDPARNQVKAGQVCTRLAQIQCAGEAFCCDAPGRDRAACETAQRDLCTSELYLDAITKNTVSGFNADAAATAFEGFEQRASQCDPTISSYAASLEGLLGMMKGTVAANGSCSPGITFDEATAAAWLASCQNIATTACLPMDALVWHCAVRGGDGASCFTDVNCQDGFYCPNPNAEFGTKKCTARKAVGIGCTSANECATLYCKGGSCVDATAQAAYCLAEP